MHRRYAAVECGPRRSLSTRSGSAQPHTPRSARPPSCFPMSQHAGTSSTYLGRPWAEGRSAFPGHEHPPRQHRGADPRHHQRRQRHPQARRPAGRPTAGPAGRKPGHWPMVYSHAVAGVEAGQQRAAVRARHRDRERVDRRRQEGRPDAPPPSGPAPGPGRTKPGRHGRVEQDHGRGRRASSRVLTRPIRTVIRTIATRSPAAEELLSSPQRASGRRQPFTPV